MTTIIPITLVGDNLGKRHLYLNSLVNETYKHGEDFDIIKNLPELSPIDRLFKIDLASKIKNVDYIIQNLKDDDMLYVSRALKAKWLIDKKYEDIINPQYLEDILYPEMITTAVNKMQRWIHLNLKDELRCQQFYQYYQETNYALALKFLTKCAKYVIQIEFPKVMHKVTPHILKILCEKCSHVAIIFFDALSHDKKLIQKYLDRHWKYFQTLRYLLKTDGDIVLDITERYFHQFQFKRFNPIATKFIMTHHKSRFLEKPELYAGMLLDIPSIANCISSEEAKDLVLKLAPAKYLYNRFSFKMVEPLIKRINHKDRAEFKKKVFIRKEIGEIIRNWPYKAPSAPSVVDMSQFGKIYRFNDLQPKPSNYEQQKLLCHRPASKRKASKQIKTECKIKTPFDKMFDEYRFASFGQTLYELRKRLATESSNIKREFMMLVLVSKTGSRPEAIASLLELLLDNHLNKPPNVRATIVRSLVKRAHIWRLPEIYWKQFLEFGRDLGLEGGRPAANCHEGLHAVVIRNLLLTGECPPAIKNAFTAPTTLFSNFTNYSLSATEKARVGYLLPKMLLSVAREKTCVRDAVHWIHTIIDVLNVYKIKVESYPGLIDTVIELVDKDKVGTNKLIRKLFDAKIARNKLFPFTFTLTKSDAAYLNVLKHDATLLYADKFFLTQVNIRADQYFKKLSIYFSEGDGLASKVLSGLKTNDHLFLFRIPPRHRLILNNPNNTDRNKLCNPLGRPIAILLKGQHKSFLQELHKIHNDKSKSLASAIKANLHMARPAIDVSGWKNTNTKFIANKMLKCRSIEIDNNIEELLKLKRTAKIAYTLSKRTNYEIDVLLKLAKIRPKNSIEPGLKIMNLQGKQADFRVWEVIKPLIQELDLTKNRGRRLLRTVARIENIPLKIRPEYGTFLYTLYKNVSLNKALPILCHLEILLPDVNEQFLENLFHAFLEEYLSNDSLSEPKVNARDICLFVRVLVKYILISKGEDIQARRVKTFGDPFLAKLEEIRQSSKHKSLFLCFVNEMLNTFQYNKGFLDIHFVSPLPVIEQIKVWLHKNFLFERHFGIFLRLEFTTFYYKAVRECIELLPEVFSDKDARQTRGATEVANVFGKYIARDVNSLVAKHFDSIIELYSKKLADYLRTYDFHYSSLFMLSMVKSILKETKGTEYRLVIHLLNDVFYLKDLSKEIYEHIHEVNNMEGEWFESARTFVMQYKEKPYPPPNKLTKIEPKYYIIKHKTPKGKIRKVKIRV